MVFNSVGFLTFFCLVAVLYYAVPHRYRLLLLLVASACFYSTFTPIYLLLLLGVTAVSYAAGLAMALSANPRHRIAALSGGITAVVGTLGVFKYSGSVPPGLSFYVFSCVSYLLDVHAGRTAAERHAGRFATYVSFFPKLVAGPIERAQPFLAQLARPVVFSDVGVTAGLRLILWGLFKKVVIADRLAVFVDATYGQPAFASPADLVIATYFFAFQLYCDFSGYSDIAIGAAKVLGFNLVENFRRPYLARSVREFWTERWHLSLASWFRDYIYVPLGGSRVSPFRRGANVMAVFLVSGLWHGASWTFLVWAGLNGTYHILSVSTARIRDRVTTLAKVPERLRAILGTFITFHLILASWIFFRASSLSDATEIMSRVIAAWPRLPALLRLRLFSAEVWPSVAIVALLVGVELLDEHRSIWERLGARPVYVRWAAYYALLGGLVVLGTWKLQQFVYMQF